MPTPLTGLYFPETIAQYPCFSQLLLFLEMIVQYLPAEDSGTPEALLIEKGLLEQRLPIPFAEDLLSFQKLIKDLGGQGNAFYGSYLSSLSNSAAIDVDEATVWNLIGQMNPKDKGLSKNNKRESQFQARLLLKLTERQAAEDKDVNIQMASLKTKEDALLSALQGTHGIPILSGMPTFKEPENPTRIKQRLKAWTHLLLADTKPTPWLAITSSHEMFDLLQETTLLTGEPPFLELPLPELSYQEDNFTTYFSQRQDFRHASKSAREALHDLLREAAKNKDADSQMSREETLTQWQEALQTLEVPCKTALRFYRFKQPLPHLFCQACGLKEAQFEQKSLYPNTIIGLLS